MNLQKAIESARNDLAFKLDDLSNKIREEGNDLRFKEEHVLAKIRNNLPFPSKVFRKVSDFLRLIACKAIVFCETCDVLPCACHREQESFSKEDTFKPCHDDACYCLDAEEKS